VHVVADLGGLADHHAHAVIDEHSPPYARAGMDLDARQNAADVRRRATDPAQAMPPEPMRDLVQPERMQARVARQHFPMIARRRIAVEDGIDVFSKSLEHSESMLGYPTISVN
jgi:hypothetical protein